MWAPMVARQTLYLYAISFHTHGTISWLAVKDSFMNFLFELLYVLVGKL